MQFNERELEDWLIENPKAFSVEGNFRWLGRQVKVASGIIDLLGLSKWESDAGVNIHVHVVELKACEGKSEHVAQVCRYAADIDDATPANFGVIEYTVLKYLIVCGNPVAQLQFEADSVGVELRTVAPIFSISAPWNFNGDAQRENQSTNRSAFKKFIQPVSESILGNYLHKSERGEYEAGT